MSTEDPFVTALRTNLNAFNANAEERVQRQRKKRRNRILWRLAGHVVAAGVGFGIGMAIVTVTQAIGH